jgi:predicted transcriptional regulator
MAKISLINSLIELDLSPNDAEVYVALIAESPCTAGPIIAKTNLHRNIVYTSINHLLESKLISESLVNGKKQLTITDPKIFVEDFVYKTDLAKTVSAQIEAIRKTGAQEITIHEGNTEYLNLLTGLLKSLPKKSTKYVLGTGGDIFMKNTMLPIWNKYHNVARGQQLNIKMIGYEPQRGAIDPHTTPEGMYDIRYLPANMQNPAGLHIYPAIDTVLNIIYADEIQPVTAIRIKNKSLTLGYLNLFENLWKQGKA